MPCLVKPRFTFLPESLRRARVARELDNHVVILFEKAMANGVDTPARHYLTHQAYVEGAKSDVYKALAARNMHEALEALIAWRALRKNPPTVRRCL